MNDKLKLFLWFQVIPLAFVAMAAFTLWSGIFHGYHAYGEIGTPFMTDWERNPAQVMHQFWQTLEFAAFFFLIGLPFEYFLLRIYDEDKRIAARNVRTR